MFTDYLLDYISASYNNRILLLDDEGLVLTAGVPDKLMALGFDVVFYNDDLSFRIEHETKLESDEIKIVVIANSKQYIPYDIRRRLRSYSMSLNNLFPKLNIDVLREQDKLDFDLLCMAYKKNFDNLSSRKQTEDFLHYKVYGKENILDYVDVLAFELKQKTAMATSYSDWIVVSEIKATIDVLTAEHQIEVETQYVNEAFCVFALQNFGKLSSEISLRTPVLVSRAMEYMADKSKKYVVIVMDGMSEFDWIILSESFRDLKYTQSAAFAMIPTTTSVSRQCLLSGKYPSQLLEPWKQNKERQEFVSCAKSLGFADNQIGYERGYNAQFNSFVRCGAVIINDIDDIVHAQKQGRLGMFNDIRVLRDQHKLYDMVCRFLSNGFDVFITADHGNTPCRGLGKLIGTGLEVETKSRRMLVLQDFANKDVLLKKYDMIDYPKYYLKKDYDYLICKVGDSFDAKDEDVMTHGGISIDEVIVPFITIKAVDNIGKNSGICM